MFKLKVTKLLLALMTITPLFSISYADLIVSNQTTNTIKVEIGDFNVCWNATIDASKEKTYHPKTLPCKGYHFILFKDKKTLDSCTNEHVNVDKDNIITVKYVNNVLQCK